MHSGGQGKKPDFQEFLLIPKLNSVKYNLEASKQGKKESEYFQASQHSPNGIHKVLCLFKLFAEMKTATDTYCMFFFQFTCFSLMNMID